MEKHSSPWNQPPMKSATQIHYETSKCLFQSHNWPHWRRCECQWEEGVSETNSVLSTSSSCVLLMVVSCLLQISACLACDDGWARPRQSPDTPLMSHSSLSKSAPSPCTATQWRVMDGLRLSYMQDKVPPRFIIKGDSYKTEHILWLKSSFCSNPTSRKLALTIIFFLSFYFALCFHDFFFFLCLIFLGRCFLHLLK